MKRTFYFLAVVVSTLFFSACRTSEIAYINDAERDKAAPYSHQFSKGIQPNDLLYIYVESQSPESAVPFNQETNKVAVRDGVALNATGGATKVQGYLVNQEGDITFPVIGSIHVEGLTHRQLADTLEKRLVAEGYITDPIVTVKLLNFKVSILGDVAKPGQIVVDGERITIFEALSMVGDLTIYGQRENVTIVREENGMRTIGTLNLSSKEVFDSPYYYLHQNDMVYVEPNKRRKRNAQRDPQVLSYVSSAVSIVSVLASAFYYYVLSKYYSNK